jgi:hypothetical protein
MPADGLTASVSKKALGGAVAGSLRARWKRYAGELEAADRQNRQKHGGRAPDFGDPMVALAGIGAAVEKLAGVLESSKHAKLSLVPHDDRVEGRLELEPEPGGKAAASISEMAIGDLAPLLALPRAMDLVVVNRTTSAGRAESAESLVEGASRLFGDRLSAADRKRVEQVAGDLAAGRGDVAAYGLHSRDGKTSLVYRGPVADEKRFLAGIKGAIDLLELRAVSEPVKQFVGEIATKQGTREIEGVGKVNRLALTLKPSAMRTAQGGAPVVIGQRDFELVWLVKDGVGHAAISSDPTLAMIDLIGAQGEHTLTSDRSVAASVARVGGSASFTLYAQPLRLGLGHSMKSSAPLVVALGKTGSTGFVKLDADGAALKALVQRFARF